ncbi:hypothetical protein K501DRAFT_280012 [Backusella circina FSU 941]|nr:hypothetical protein K501DRAFT_280012 [Backusella circina FSU 941]
MNTDKKYYTADWPRNSSYGTRINVMEFYHKILWDSQNNSETNTENDTRIKRRVRFSQEPPEVFEYEPEETKYRSFFDYHSLARKQKKLRLDTKEKYPHKEIASVKDISPILSYKTLRANTRSISDFRPIINDQFKVPPYSIHAFNSSHRSVFLKDYASCLSNTPQEPPPSYKEYENITSRNEKGQRYRRLSDRI